MLASHAAIETLADACAYVGDTLRHHPERDAFAAYEAALAGTRRRYPALSIAHLQVPADQEPLHDEFTPPPVNAPAGPDGDLVREAVGCLQPLAMDNPVAPAFNLGKGPGTLATCFGIPLNPEAENCPAFSRPMSQVLADPEPDPQSAGLLPEIHEKIDRIKAATPPWFKIRMPDLQGPFNIVHNVIGIDALTAPYEEEDAFHALMERVTTFWIAVQKDLARRIGPERLVPNNRMARIAECSVNLVSPEFYQSHILPQDQRIAAAFGALHIHPCSGPHVFHATLENLPVCVTEAGHIERTAAGAISVDDAARAIADRPILLCIGQELPEGREYEFIRADLERYAANPRLLFNYTGMHWRRKDRPRIRAIHRRLDEDWARLYG